MNISVLQWNIWFKEDPERIVKEIQKIDPDIVCAQELIQLKKAGRQVDTAKFIAEKLGYDYVYQEAETWSQKKEKDSQGNAIFSRLAIKKTRHVYVQKPKHNPSDASHEGRVYVEADIKVGAKLVKVGTTHLSYSHQFVISNHRKKEVDNLIKIVKEPSKNYLFGGDLNSLPDSFTINQLEKLSNIKHVGPDYSQSTFANKPFDKDGFRVDDLSLRLDYVFVSKNIEVESAEVVKTPVSDHLPILVNVKF